MGERSISDAMARREPPLRILFICSRNQWRSPTAERVVGRWPGVEARSAGTSPRARHSMSEPDIRWADMVIVMEQKHRQRVVADFAQLMRHRAIHVLDIPDDYRFMDPELVAWIEDAVAPLIKDSGTV